MRAFRVTVGAEDEEAASVALWEAGTVGVEVRPAPGGRLTLVAYFPADLPPPDPRALPPGARVAATEIPQIDWVARFRESFRAFPVGRFVVAPAWQTPVPSGGDVLLVDPGRAFGTGTHETTRLCLGALEEVASRRRLGRALDLGCGTGLLAVAAARLGASLVVASDVDPEAIASSRAHARLNREDLRLVRADGARGLRPRAFDLVVANLMALLLVDRAPQIAALLAPGGVLVLSGILREDVPFVSQAFSGLGLPAERTDGEWVALLYEATR